MGFKSKKKDIPNGNSGLLQPGAHLCTIKSIKETVAKLPKSGLWKDQTPQIEVVFEKEEKIITMWVNMKGYETARDDKHVSRATAPKGFEYANSSDETNEQYVVNTKTRTRVEDPAKSEIGIKIIGELASDAGIAEDAEFELDELVGMEIGVTVREVAGRLEVHYTMPADSKQLQPAEE